MKDSNNSVRLVEGAAATVGGIDPDLIGSVEVMIEAYLGSSRLKVSELMALKAGSVVSLDASLDRDVELRLNGVTIGRGELVTIDDRYGVRIIELAK